MILYWWSAFIDIFMLASLCLLFPLNSQYISVSHLFGCYISCSLPPVSHPPAAGANLPGAPDCGVAPWDGSRDQ